MSHSIVLFNLPGVGDFHVPLVGPEPWINYNGANRMSTRKRLKAKRAKQMRKLRRKQGRV